jgi:hypothetical protein
MAMRWSLGFDLSSVQWARMDNKGVAGLVYAGAALRQFGTQGSNTLAFLHPQPTKIGK